MTDILDNDEKRYFLTLKGMIVTVLLNEKQTMEEASALTEKLMASIKNYATRVSQNEDANGLPAIVFESPDSAGYFVTITKEVAPLPEGKVQVN